MFKPLVCSQRYSYNMFKFAALIIYTFAVGALAFLLGCSFAYEHHKELKASVESKQ